MKRAARRDRCSSSRCSALWQVAVMSGALVAGAAALAVGRRASTSARRARATARSLEAIGVTLRRLLLGYAIGVVLGLPLGLAHERARRFVEDTLGVAGARAADAAERLLGAAGAALVRADARARCCSSSSWARSGRWSSRPTPARARSRRSTRAPRAPWAPTASTHWTRVILPASLPFLVSGMKQGWAFAWRSLMAAEIYVTILTGFGLGHLLHYGRELHAMDQVIGIMLVIVADRPAGRQAAVLAVGAVPAPALGNERPNKMNAAKCFRCFQEVTAYTAISLPPAQPSDASSAGAAARDGQRASAAAGPGGGLTGHRFCFDNCCSRDERMDIATSRRMAYRGALRAHAADMLGGSSLNRGRCRTARAPGRVACAIRQPAGTPTQAASARSFSMAKPCALAIRSTRRTRLFTPVASAPMRSTS